MNRHEINHIASFPPVSRSSGLIRCEINGMKYVAKKFIALRREKPKVTVSNPLELHLLAETFDQGSALAGVRFQPSKAEAGPDNSSGVAFRRSDESFLRILKNVDIS